MDATGDTVTGVAIGYNTVASHDSETRFFDIINPVSGGVFLSE